MLRCGRLRLRENEDNYKMMLHSATVNMGVRISTVVLAISVVNKQWTKISNFDGQQLQKMFRRVCKIAKSVSYFVMPVRLSVCPPLSICNSCAPTGHILMKLNIWVFFENMWKNFKFFLSDKVPGTLHEDVCLFMRVSHWIVLRTRNVSEENCRENKKKHVLLW